MKIQIFKSKVLNIKNISKDVKSLNLSVPKGFEFRAGQYLSLSVFDKTGKKFRRPLSTANAPKRKNDKIEFCAKLIPGGLASEFIRKLKAGDEVELFGPAGKFCVDLEGKDRDKELFFIAAGVGVAPFVGMVQDLLENNFKKKIVLLKSSRGESESLYDTEFLKLAREYENFEFHNVYSHPQTSEGKFGDVGHVQNFLKKRVPRNFEGNFYICGLKEMISETREKLKELGFRDEQIFEEKFD